MLQWVVSDVVKDEDDSDDDPLSTAMIDGEVGWCGEDGSQSKKMSRCSSLETGYGGVWTNKYGYMSEQTDDTHTNIRMVDSSGLAIQHGFLVTY